LVKSKRDILRIKSIPGLNRQVALFLLYSCIFHIGLFGITDVLLNFYLVSIGYDPEAIGLLQALPRLSGFLTGIPVGLVANRFGNRNIIIVSTWGIALCVALTALVQSLFVLALTRFLWGVFFGAGQVVKPPFMVTLTSKEEHTAQFSYHNLVSMVAVAFGSILGGFMPVLVSRIFLIEGVGNIAPEQMPEAYQGAILIAAFIILFSTLSLLWLHPNSSKIADDDSEKLWKKAKYIPWQKIIKLSLPLFVFGISGGLTFPFFNLFFREQFGIADSAIGGILGLGWLVMGLIPLLNPVWEARMGRVMALTLLMTVSSLTFVGLALAETLIISVIFYVIAIGTRNTMQPIFQPLLMDQLASEFHNIASSIGLVLWNIGWFGATLMFGYLQVTIGFSQIMLVVAFFVFLNGVSIYFTNQNQ